MPRVSVIIGAYNPGPFLPATVQAVIDQTFQDWEIIIVDDGSTEDISAIAEMHEAITYIRQENRGLSIARNVAVLRSQGEYLAVLDQDDVWLPTKLERQVAAMDESPEVGLCYTNFEMIDAAGRRIGPGFDGGTETYVGLLHGCCINASSVLLRREALAASGLFNPFYVGTQDYDMWLKVARQHPMRYVPTIEAQYRQHDNNLSRKYALLFREVEHLFQRHIALARNAGDNAALAAAVRGLKRARVVYGSQAFDKCRRSVRERAFGPMVAHGRFAAQVAPGFVLQSLLTYGLSVGRGRGAKHPSSSTSL